MPAVNDQPAMLESRPGHARRQRPEQQQCQRVVHLIPHSGLEHPEHFR